MDMKKLLATALMVPLDREWEVAFTDMKHRFGLPICFVGEPGTAKSDVIEEVTSDMTFLTNVVFIPSETPETLGGIPVMHNGKLIRMTDDQIIHELKETGEGCVFLDEINTNSQNIYRSLLAVLLKRRYGGVQLSGRVRFIAARNPTASSAGGIEFPAPVANRFCHINWEAPDVEQWCDWVIGAEKEDKKNKTLTAKELETKLIDNWPAAWSEFSAKGTGFIRSMSTSLHALPDISSEAFSGSWPSRRSWWWALRAAAAARALNSGEQIRIALMRGCVGDGAVKQFLEWEKRMDLQSAQDMLTNGFVPDRARIDKAMASFDTLGIYVASMKKGKDQIEAATKTWQILNKGCEVGLADTVIRAATKLVNADLGLRMTRDHGGPVDEAIEAMKPVLTRVYPIQKQAQRAHQAVSGT